MDEPLIDDRGHIAREFSATVLRPTVTGRVLGIPPRHGEILWVVARYYQVDPVALLGPSRQSQLIEPRFVAVYLVRELTDDGYSKIARTFRRDHTSIMHAYQKIQQDLTRPQHERLRSTVARLQREIRSLGLPDASGTSWAT